MKPIRTLFLVALATVVVASTARAGAWVRPSGSLYTRLAYSFLDSDNFYTRDGESISTARFSTASLDLYAEIGLGRSFDAIVRFPTYRRFAFETSEASTGIGDLGLELRRALRSGRWPVAAGLGVELPTGDEIGTTPLKGESGEAGGTIRLPTGDGEANVRGMFYLSHAFDPAPAYASLEAGYNLRTKGFTDEYLFSLQAGVKPVESVWFTIFVRGRGPVRTPDRERALEVGNGLGEGVQYTGLGGGAAVRIAPGVFVSADLFTAVGRITNIYGGRNMVLGLSWER